VRIIILSLWLVAYTLLPLAPALFAVLFAFEGAASLRAHPENLVLTLAATLFLVAWPLSALAGWVLLFLGRLKAVWTVTLATAGPLLVLWLSGLVIAALAGGRR
jgi:hypothetical protein